MKPIISAVICTRNRSGLLKKSVQSLIEQTLHPDAYEIIIVDNQSTDDTKRVISAIQEKNSKSSIVLVPEEKIGLSHARNRGWKDAKGLYIAYLDDDAAASKRWLETALDIFQNKKPTPIAVGGPEEAVYLSQKPDWYKDEYGISGTKIYGKIPKFLEKGEILKGSNMIIQKKVLEQHGGFRHEFGMKGDKLSSHEETEFFHQVGRKTGSKFSRMYYSPNLVVRHSLPLFKLSVRYILKRSFSGGQAWYRRNGKISIIKRMFLFFSGCGYVAFQTMIAVITLFKYPYTQQWMAERVSKVVFGIGFVLSSLGITIVVTQN